MQTYHVNQHLLEQLLFYAYNRITIRKLFSPAMRINEYQSQAFNFRLPGALIPLHLSQKRSQKHTVEKLLLSNYQILCAGRKSGGFSGRL